MLFKEFKQKLRNKHKQFNFIVVRAVKDTYSPCYHSEYNDHYSILSSYEVFKEEGCWADNYIIINPHQHPISWASGVNWHHAFMKGDMECVIIISEEDAKLLCVNQSTIDFIGKACERYLAGDRDWQDAWLKENN